MSEVHMTHISLDICYTTQPTCRVQEPNKATHAFISKTNNRSHRTWRWMYPRALLVSLIRTHTCALYNTRFVHREFVLCARFIYKPALSEDVILLVSNSLWCRILQQIKWLHVCGFVVHIFTLGSFKKTKSKPLTNQLPPQQWKVNIRCEGL